MWHVSLFTILLTLSAALALWLGGPPERLGALAIIGGYVLTLVAYSSSPLTRFRNLDTGVLIIDVVVFLLFLALALCSTRYSPTWAAGIQLATLVVHVLRLLPPAPFALPYATVLALLGYPVVALVGLGAWRHHRRVNRFGDERSWRTFSRP